MALLPPLCSGKLITRVRGPAKSPLNGAFLPALCITGWWQLRNQYHHLHTPRHLGSSDECDPQQATHLSWLHSSSVKVGRTLPPSPHMDLQDPSLFTWLLVDRRTDWRAMRQLWSAREPQIPRVECIMSLKMPVQGLGALIPL